MRSAAVEVLAAVGGEDDVASRGVHRLITPAAGRLLIIALVETGTTGEVLVAGALEVRPCDGLALAQGRAMVLSVREFALLVELMRRGGTIATRAQLYASAWGGALRPHDRSVDVYVHKVRSKLEEMLPEWRFIHTHTGFGYRFAPERSQPFYSAGTGSQQHQADGGQAC